MADYAAILSTRHEGRVTENDEIREVGDKKTKHCFFILEQGSKSYYFIWYDVTFFNLEYILYFYPYFGKKTTNVYIWSFLQIKNSKAPIGLV